MTSSIVTTEESNRNNVVTDPGLLSSLAFEFKLMFSPVHKCVN